MREALINYLINCLLEHLCRWQRNNGKKDGHRFYPLESLQSNTEVGKLLGGGRWCGCKRDDPTQAGGEGAWEGLPEDLELVTEGEWGKIQKEETVQPKCGC